MKKSLLFVTLLWLGLTATADDGMWMPHQMKDLNLKEQGLRLDPADLYKTDGSGLMSAVVHLGGGTGEFVSPAGLILTNHHVAFGAIQRASDKEHDYIADGFLAPDRAAEIPAAGYIADVLLHYEDITERILSRLKKKQTPYQRYKQLESLQKEIIRQAESRGADLHCSIASMYNGNRYYLYTCKRLKDLRLVYAPPQTIGNFGGEDDNWMWPRHTCDFSFLRAYVSPDNTGREYHKDNVPYQPKSFLTLSLKGVRDGDFSFIMGYPGRTYRSYSSAQFNAEIEDLRQKLEQSRQAITFFEQAGKTDRAIQIKYASLVKGLHNGLKNTIGKLEGFAKRRIPELKRQREEEFVAAIADGKDRQLARQSLQRISDFIENNRKFGQRYELLNRLKSPRSGAALLGQACTLYKAAVERRKPDIDREAEYQDRELPRLRQRIQLAERSYDFETDKAYLKFILHQYLDKSDLILPAGLKEAMQKSGAALDELVDLAYAATGLGDVERRLALLEQSPEQLKKSGDPLLQLAAELDNLGREYEKQNQAMTQELSDLRRDYLAIALTYDAKLAPDANSTIRFTSGVVDGYSPRDAVYYRSKTSLKGVMDKEQTEFPFAVPSRLKDLHQRKDFGRYADSELGDVATCFLNTTNVTGGNSGSPSLNADGEQTGIIFDMTYESVTGDYFIIPELQRTISVDIRYVLFITEKFSGAGYLLDEMVIKQ